MMAIRRRECPVRGTGAIWSRKTSARERDCAFDTRQLNGGQEVGLESTATLREHAIKRRLVPWAAWRRVLPPFHWYRRAQPVMAMRSQSVTQRHDRVATTQLFASLSLLASGRLCMERRGLIEAASLWARCTTAGASWPSSHFQSRQGSATTAANLPSAKNARLSWRRLCQPSLQPTKKSPTTTPPEPLRRKTC